MANPHPVLPPADVHHGQVPDQPVAGHGEVPIGALIYVLVGRLPVPVENHLFDGPARGKTPPRDGQGNPRRWIRSDIDASDEGDRHVLVEPQHRCGRGADVPSPVHRGHSEQPDPVVLVAVAHPGGTRLRPRGQSQLGELFGGLPGANEAEGVHVADEVLRGLGLFPGHGKGVGGHVAVFVDPGQGQLWSRRRNRIPEVGDRDRLGPVAGKVRGNDPEVPPSVAIGLQLGGGRVPALAKLPRYRLLGVLGPHVAHPGDPRRIPREAPAHAHPLLPRGAAGVEVKGPYGGGRHALIRLEEDHSSGGAEAVFPEHVQLFSDHHGVGKERGARQSTEPSGFPQHAAPVRSEHLVRAVEPEQPQPVAQGYQPREVARRRSPGRGLRCKGKVPVRTQLGVVDLRGVALELALPHQRQPVLQGHDKGPLVDEKLRSPLASRHRLREAQLDRPGPGNPSVAALGSVQLVRQVSGGAIGRPGGVDR